jgi:hypothetical protein
MLFSSLVSSVSACTSKSDKMKEVVTKSEKKTPENAGTLTAIISNSLSIMDYTNFSEVKKEKLCLFLKLLCSLFFNQQIIINQLLPFSPSLLECAI